MPLLIHLPGLDPLPLSEVILTRAMGRPVEWRLVQEIKPESWGAREAELVQKIAGFLAGDPKKVRVSWEGKQGAEIASDIAIVAATHHGMDSAAGAASGYRPRDSHFIELSAVGTFVAEAPDAFVPRRRVHRVENLKELLAGFEHVVAVKGALQSDLERVKFPDGAKTSIVQDGLSDWDFTFRILAHCRSLAQGSPWLPLTLTGSVDDGIGTRGKWLLVPAAKPAYENWSAIKERTIKFDEDPEVDGSENTQFESIESLYRVPKLCSGRAPVVVTRRVHRHFTEERWKKWCKIDVPRFSQHGDMIWKITDRMSTGADGNLEWDTSLSKLPEGAVPWGPDEYRSEFAWSGLGRVKSTSRDGPWVEIQLPGFESGSDTIHARIGTPYSGTNGGRGLHMVPENDTEVLLNWSGRFDNSIIMVANTRESPAENASPSLVLEAELLSKYDKITIQSVGDVSVGSDLAVDVAQSTNVTGADPLKITANGAVLEMKAGSVFTGPG